MQKKVRKDLATVLKIMENMKGAMENNGSQSLIIMKGGPLKHKQISASHMTQVFRFYEAHYAYTRFYIRKKDFVNYEHMLIINLSHSREVCAMLEHALIVHFQCCEPRRCANRKNDLDNHLQKDDPDSEDERGVGPFAVYVVVGKKF